ncbi:Transmembrane amino acid transporter protein [Teratosphaeria destructans]|uniref:Transmembrane amino acid transporter protein n=1 Tax=Teratosphaeria destructans TaxID=418781 RepID=A0A9W7SMF7_9PEZI|nr:Transmembrane amino acid transporter protein [Teratosphaeria destructans]
MAAFVSPAGLGGVADPRLGDEADNIGKARHGSVAANYAPGPADTGRRGSAIYTDSSITFEDYHYWAGISREQEKSLETKGVGLSGWVRLLVGKGIHHGTPPDVLAAEGRSSESGGEKTQDKAAEAFAAPSTAAPNENRYGIAPSEWDQAQRAGRTATWGAIFYLITTDILGPYNVPWAIAQFGYGPGFALYTVFGGMAFYSGLQLWRMFVGLDSTRYPLRNYGDLAFRVYGNWARQLVNVLQSFQFFLNVALIIESSSQGLAQMAAGKSGNGFLCFVVAEVIFTIAGFILGQIRTLQRLSWLSNVAIWLNVIVIIMTMVVVHSYPPNYAAVKASYGYSEGPVITTANWPPNTPLISRLNGMMNCVFAYGGATLFNELMAEMRRPMDFWKGFICAEIFIYAVYLIMGMVVYSAQGQFTYNPAYQGIPSSAYSWQTLGNAISLISALIAALLYGNIGIKVIYAAVLRDIFKFPSLNTKKGKFIWVAIIPIYWALAFVVAAAIPQIANLTAFVGAACILQFSYTFPPWLHVGYNCQKDAILPEEEFDPGNGTPARVDHGFERWVRGFKKQFALNTFNSLYALAALATAGLGIYASVIGMHDTFTSPDTSITPFSCTNPAG